MVMYAREMFATVASLKIRIDPFLSFIQTRRCLWASGVPIKT